MHPHLTTNKVENGGACTQYTSFAKTIIVFANLLDSCSPRKKSNVVLLFMKLPLMHLTKEHFVS